MAKNPASKAAVKNPTAEDAKIASEEELEESFLSGSAAPGPQRHSRSGQLDAMLRRRSRRAAKEQANFSSSGEEGEGGGCGVHEGAACAAASPTKLRGLPVEAWRHAPPSPLLSFKVPASSSSSSVVLSQEPSIMEMDELELQEETQLPGRLPEELWLRILSDIIDVPTLARLAPIAARFADLVRVGEVWRDREVRIISPKYLEKLAPKLSAWLPAWRSASRLVVPKSQQLLAEIARLAPELRVDVAWRFNNHQRGAGVDIVDFGMTARRVANKELVVLGDAPLLCGLGGQYLEVCLDERGEDLPEDEDGLNDFGLGVTACDPDEIDELGAVAVEVPRSWVVDFTKTGVALSVNDELAAKGSDLTADELRQGDHVGLRITPGGCVEVFINGRMRQLLSPAEAQRVPQAARLFPVLDLCGPSVQISRTGNIELPL